MSLAIVFIIVTAFILKVAVNNIVVVYVAVFPTAPVTSFERALIAAQPASVLSCAEPVHLTTVPRTREMLAQFGVQHCVRCFVLNLVVTIFVSDPGS